MSTNRVDSDELPEGILVPGGEAAAEGEQLPDEERSSQDSEPEASLPLVEEELVEAAEPQWRALVEEAQDQELDASDPVVQLVHEYKEAIKARDEWQDKYLRAAAEFSNAKRRAELRADNQIWSAQERILASILPVLDDLERAFDNVSEDEQESPWVEGFVLIQRKLMGVLERQGVSTIEAEGEPFDPNLHQAVIVEPAEDVEPDTVVSVLQKGYMLGDRVLRPSMVKVAQ
jgi:molecular chaperone GrpE